MLEQFILRKFFVSAFNWVKKNISQIVNFIFGSFKKMPVRVSLAILGSSALTISFIAGLLFGFLSVTFFDDTFKHTLQNGFYAVLLIVLIWISISTFIPSLERQPKIVEAPPVLQEPDETEAERLLEY